jgi:hypothetical protein
MTTSIKTWQIKDGRLHPLETSLATEGRTEAYDLEAWIETDPSILSSDLVLVGRQVATRSGPLDLMAVDRSGNIVIIELKRDRLPREVLAQAIDYASDVAGWSVERIGEVCAKHTGRDLQEVLADAFPDLDLETINLNESQRIILVGFSIDSALERMISWLSSSYGVSINAVLLHYVRTSSGDEILTKTSIISEELEQERVQKKKFQIPMSDDPGTYEIDELKKLLEDYFAQDYVTIRLMRDEFIPILLEKGTVSRQNLVNEFDERRASDSQTSAGYIFVQISRQVGMAKNDFLRQVIGYEYPNNPWEKDNYSIREEYRELMSEVLQKLSNVS